MFAKYIFLKTLQDIKIIFQNKKIYLFKIYKNISRNSINLGENIEIADNHPKIEKKIEIEIKSDKIKSQPQSA